MATRRLLIVGSGITGCCLSLLLSRAVRPGALETILWEKSNGVGGRMATRRSNAVTDGQVDLGAQFFSVPTSNYEMHKDYLHHPWMKSLYDELLSEKILIPLPIKVGDQREFPQGTKHYVAPAGASSVPKAFLRKSGASVCFRRQVSRVEKENEKWKVSAQDGSHVMADIVVLTMPIPQILSLKGDIPNLIPADVRARLEAVKYSSRYALGLFYGADTKLDIDWEAKYISNNACLRFVCQDQLKRGQPDMPASVLIHTTVPFGLQFLESNTSDIYQKLISESRKALPELPDPAEMKFHKWRYSQIYQPYEGAPGFVCPTPGSTLLLSGDSFVHSNANGCMTSAKKTFEFLMREFPELRPE